jgi:hypothetical protein
MAATAPATMPVSPKCTMPVSPKCTATAEDEAAPKRIGLGGSVHADQHVWQQHPDCGSEREQARRAPRARRLRSRSWLAALSSGSGRYSGI